MPIEYVRDFPRTYLSFLDHCPGRRILLFDPVLERFSASSSLADRFRRIDESSRNCDVVVVRGRGARMKESLARSEQQLKRLARGVPILTCTGALGQSLPLIEGEPISGNTGKLIDLDVIRQIEIESILLRSEAIFSGSKIHYVLPSGWHTPKFIRMGDALQDMTEVTRLVDWILPHLSDRAVVLADTGALLPLLLALQREAHIISGWQISIRSFGEYPLDGSGFGDVLLEAEERCRWHKGTEIVLIVSVSSSGRLIQKFRALANVATRIVVICDTSASPSTADVTLMKYPIERWKPGPNGRCERCDVDEALSIDPRTYERLPRQVWRANPVDRRLAVRNAKFWEAVDQVDGVELHVNRQYPGESSRQTRHHGIYLDTLKVLSNAEIAHSTVSYIREKLRRPAAVVIPRHRASEAVANLLRDAFPGISVLFIGESGLQAEERALLEKLSGKDTVLVADDALVGGRTMVGLKQAIYGATRREQQPRVQAFVVVARPPTESALAGVKRIFRDAEGEQFFFAYLVYLPGPDESHCPWCQERVQLQRYMDRLVDEGRKYAEGRVQNLVRELEPPFLLGGEALSPDDKTQNSFFGSLRPKAAFAAASSAVQELLARMNSSKSGDREVVDLPMAIQCYFDSVLLSAVLRSCRRLELDFPGHHEMTTAELLKKKHQSNMAGLVGEVGWAAVQDKVPKEPVVQLLENAESGGAIEMLKQLLSMKEV